MSKKTIKEEPKVTEKLEAEITRLQTQVDILLAAKKPATVTVSKSNTILFGLTGDRHYGSLHNDSAAIKAFYDYAKRQGVKQVFDAGDITEGHKIYRGQEFEVRDLGYEAQVNRLVKEAPRSIETYFITGNHDASFRNLAGAAMGKDINQRIPNYHFLGEMYARHIWKTPNGPVALDLLHPDGGTAYAISYKTQKIVESLEGGTKPDVIGIGHFHKAEMLPMYRNVAAFQTGTFQHQTEFMRRKGSQAHVGGWIVEVKIGPKKATKTIRAEFVAFYV